MRHLKSIQSLNDQTLSFGATVAKRAHPRPWEAHDRWTMLIRTLQWAMKNGGLERMDLSGMGPKNKVTSKWETPLKL